MYVYTLVFITIRNSKKTNVAISQNVELHTNVRTISTVQLNKRIQIKVTKIVKFRFKMSINKYANL